MLIANKRAHSHLALNLLHFSASLDPFYMGKGGNPNGLSLFAQQNNRNEAGGSLLKI